MQKKQLNYKKYFIRTLITILLSSGLISCATVQNVSSISSIGKDDVLLVGKVILEPALGSNEYKKIITIQGTTGYIYLYSSNKLKPLESLEVGFKEVVNSIKTENVRTFYIKIKNQPLYIYYGFIMMDIDHINNVGVYAYLPAGWIVNAQSGDKAVYIGTIKYQRDEFFRITKVEIIDEFETVSKEFYEKYGNAVPLKKSLLKSM